MKKTVLLSFFTLCVSLLSGCSILPEARPLAVNYYDLGNFRHENAFLPGDIRVGHVKSAFPSEKRMIFREGGSRLIFDECNRWALPPEQLVVNRMRLAIPPKNLNSQTRTERTLDAEILSLECDLKAKTANFAIRFDLHEAGGGIIMSKIFSESVTMDDMTAGGFADAIAKSVDSTLQRFAKECSP